MRTLLIALFTAAAPAAADPFAARVRFDDVDRFYTLLDTAGPAPTAAALARDYIEAGSPGVREFVEGRIVSPQALATKIAEDPALYARARACRPLLPAVERRMRAAYLALQYLLPNARLPDTTILVGRGNSGGTARPWGVLIGLEVICDPARAADAAPMAHLIAHELAHTQQAFFKGGTLLDAALNEGVAEFVGELISGQVSNAGHAASTAGREAEIEGAFAAAMHGQDTTRWLYNGPGTPAWPADLGYWAGHRIARAYFDRAPDKRAAIRAMLTATDARAFLAASGWRPAR